MRHPQTIFVTIELTASGRAALAKATASKIGDRLAIVVDDEVVALPVINRSLDIPSLPLMPQTSPAAAEALAARINQAIAHARQ